MGEGRLWEKRQCPRCGAWLISNGRRVWCSFIGGVGEPACRYGLDEDVTQASYFRSYGGHK